MKKNLFVLVCLVALTNPCYAGFGSFLKDCADLAVPGFGFNEAQNVQDAGKMVLQNANQTFTYDNEYIRIDDLADELTTKMEHIDYLYSNYLTDTDPETDGHEELITEINNYFSYLNGVQNLINNQIYIPVYYKYKDLLTKYKYNNNDPFIEDKRLLRSFKDEVNTSIEDSNIVKVDNLITEHTSKIKQYSNEIAKIYNHSTYSNKEITVKKFTLKVNTKIQNAIDNFNNSADKEQAFKEYFDTVTQYTDILNSKISDIGYFDSSFFKQYGFETYMAEGSYYLRYPYTNMTKLSNVPQDWQDWLYILSKRQNDLEDACLMISVEELRKAIVSMSDFIKKYPNFVAKDDVDEQLKYYYFYYLDGIDNSRIYDDETNKVKPAYINSYKTFIDTNKDCIGYKTVENYYNKLKNNNFKYVERVGSWEKLDY